MDFFRLGIDEGFIGIATRCSSPVQSGSFHIETHERTNLCEWTNFFK